MSLSRRAPIPYRILLISLGKQPLTYPRTIARALIDFTSIRADDPKIRALLNQMKEHGTILDATLRVYQQLAEHTPDAVGKGILPCTYAVVSRAAHDAGMLIDAGTDSGGLVSPREPEAGPAVVEEMALLVNQCGFSPEAAIHAATQVSAMAVGQSSHRGTTEVGIAADLVVLSADQVAEIRNVRKVVEVVKDGKTFRPAQNPY